MHQSRAQSAFEGRSRQISASIAGGEGWDEECVRCRCAPDSRRVSMLERNASLREVLCKAAPRGEVQLGGFPQLAEVTLKARTSGQQFENPVLIEYIDLILPDHVVDRR